MENERVREELSMFITVLNSVIRRNSADISFPSFTMKEIIRILEALKPKNRGKWVANYERDDISREELDRMILGESEKKESEG
jgi:hypothetical protein